MTDKDNKKDFSNYQNSPIQDKKCTDVICCIIYLLFTIAFLGIAVFAFMNGKPNILAQPYDMNHQACGISGNEDYKFIYFPNPSNIKENVCIESCPQKDQNSVKCLKNDLCKDGQLQKGQNLKVLIYESRGVYNKICIPYDKDFSKKVLNTIDIDKIEALASDLRNTWMICSLSSIIAIIIGILFMIIIRMCAGSVVWLFIIIIFSSLLTLGILFLFQYRQNTNPIDISTSKQAQQVAEAMSKFKDKNQCLVFSIILFSLAGLFFLFILCSCNRIKICTQIIKAAARFIMDNPRLLLVSLITFIFSFIYFAFWFIIAIYLYSSGGITDQPGSLPFGQVKMTREIQIMGCVHIFALFWNEAFISASMQFIIIGAVAYWYYQVPEVDDSHTTMSAKSYFANHLGTAALGSFILGVIQFLQLIVQIIENQLKSGDGSENVVVKFVMKCLQCCLACCNQCVKKINQNVYVISFVKGESFCDAVSSYLGLFASNPLRISLVSGFGYFFEILGNFAISGITSLICYQIITQTSYYQARVENPLAPVFVIAIVSFFVGSFIMSLFSVVGETMIVIYCIQDAGGSKKSQNCPKELEDFMDKN